MMRIPLVVIALINLCLLSWLSADAQDEFASPPLPRAPETLPEDSLENRVGPFLADVERRIFRIWKEQKYNSAKLSCSFTVKDNVHIGDMKITQSSGSKVIDQAALNSIRKAFVRPFPRVVSNPTLSVHFLGTFKEGVCGYPATIKVRLVKCAADVPAISGEN